MAGDDDVDWGDALAEQATAREAKEKAVVGSALHQHKGLTPTDSSDMHKLGIERLKEASITVEGRDPEINLDVLLDVPVILSMELGRTRINIRSLLQLTQGSIVELDRLAGEPLDVLVNGTLIAHGEVVVVNEKFGIRITDVVSPAERVRKLRPGS